MSTWQNSADSSHDFAGSIQSTCPTITQAELERNERNRLAALERRRQVLARQQQQQQPQQWQHWQHTPSVPHPSAYPSFAPFSQQQQQYAQYPSIHPGGLAQPVIAYQNTYPYVHAHPFSSPSPPPTTQPLLGSISFDHSTRMPASSMQSLQRHPVVTPEITPAPTFPQSFAPHWHNPQAQTNHPSMHTAELLGAQRAPMGSVHGGRLCQGLTWQQAPLMASSGATLVSSAPAAPQMKPTMLTEATPPQPANLDSKYLTENVHRGLRLAANSQAAPACLAPGAYASRPTVTGAKRKAPAGSNYGPGMDYAFTPANQTGKRQISAPRKKLTQSTLGDTMRRYRATKKAQAAANDKIRMEPEEELSPSARRCPPFSNIDAHPEQHVLREEQRPEQPPTAAQMSSGAGSIGPIASRPPGVLITQLATPHSTVTTARASQLKQRIRSLLCSESDDTTADMDSHRQQRWPWLANRRDAQGRAPDDPLWDPRTLFISSDDFEKLRGFQRQFWSIKKAAMDLVLFVRVGSFYELYDEDADVGLKVGLNPMGCGREANMWKVGCVASAFTQWAGRVLALGHSIGRVEECRGVEEPTYGRGAAGGKLVARKLAQVYTPGTVLDWPIDHQQEDDMQGPAPFVALYEGSNGLFGACVVDVTSATLALAQWQEVDATRSTLETLLAQINPAEVVIATPTALSLDTRRALKRHRRMVADGVESSLAISFLRRTSPLEGMNPDDPVQVPRLLERTESLYFALRGNHAAFKQAAASLGGMSHAAAALRIGLSHLRTTGTARHVLPNATITSVSTFTTEGALRLGRMVLDAAAIRSLELLEGSLGGGRGSLYAFLSPFAASPAGRRCIRRWICAPLYRIGDIHERLDTVQALMQLPEAAGEFQAALRGAPDCERLLPKVASLLAIVAGDCSAAPHEAYHEDEGDRDGLNVGNLDADGLMQLDCTMSQARFLPVVRLFEGMGVMLGALSDLNGKIQSIRGDAAPLSQFARALTAGHGVAETLAQLQGIFHPERFDAAGDDLRLEPGVCSEYDAAQQMVKKAAEELERVFEKERKRLTESALSVPLSAAQLRKVKLTEGSDGDALLEVPTSMKVFVPEWYCLTKETKATARYRVEELSQAKAKLADARHASQTAVLKYLRTASSLFLDSYSSFVTFVSAIAALDALACFAEATHPTSAPPNCAFCRPTFASIAASSSEEEGPPPILKFQGVWSPQMLLAERRSKAMPFVQPNDLTLGGTGEAAEAGSTLLLTGANTGGKSTLMRSACLAVIMAQMGCFVPASYAELAPVDRIFTRMGAQDRIAAGESTFCMEMTETAAVLRHAHRASLVVLDELGRGTSTNDGEAIAGAVLAWLSTKTRCRLLFATHYHGLTQDPELLRSGAQLGHMHVTVDSEQGVVPSYRFLPGPAPQGSCGAEAARGAGLPSSVVTKAQAKAKEFQSTQVERREGTFWTLAGDILRVLRDAAAGGPRAPKAKEKLRFAQNQVRKALMTET